MTQETNEPSGASPGSAVTVQSVVGATDAAGKADCKSGNGAAVALWVSAESGLTPCVRDTGNEPSSPGRKPGGNPAATDCLVMRRVVRSSSRMRRRTDGAKHRRRNLVSGKYT